MPVARRPAAATGILAAPGPRPKRTDVIIEVLREEIVSGRLPRGARLPTERELANHYGVSQPTVREVIRALDVMGLVDVRHGSGAYVRGDSAYLMATALQTMLQIESVGIVDVLDVREMLGRESVRRAAMNATVGDVAACREALGRLDRVTDLPDVDSIIDAISQFQRLLAAAAHNPFLLALETVLINLLLQIQVKVLARRGVKFWRERSSGFQTDRVSIVDAVADKDANRAAAAIETYLERQREAFLADPDLSLMRFSDAKAIRAAADAVSSVRIPD
jgi:GntR family transcriptional regulator, transcriptional repressor for pyruvate dehydrogenase complex